MHNIVYTRRLVVAQLGLVLSYNIHSNCYPCESMPRIVPHIAGIR
jgi:hypothetical protein